MVKFERFGGSEESFTVEVDGICFGSLSVVRGKSVFCSSQLCVTEYIKANANDLRKIADKMDEINQHLKTDKKNKSSD